MADFDLGKITGREPPLVTDDERDAEIAYLSDVVTNRDRELAALRARVAELEADAARFRWIKRVHEHGDESVTEWIGFYSADQWDAEIDKHCADNKTEVRK